MNNLIFSSIRTLIPELNNNWATIISERMKVSPQTIRAYSRGERGLQSGKHVALLQEMQKLNQEIENQTKTLLSLNIQTENVNS